MKRAHWLLIAMLTLWIGAGCSVHVYHHDGGPSGRKGDCDKDNPDCEGRGGPCCCEDDCKDDCQCPCADCPNKPDAGRRCGKCPKGSGAARGGEAGYEPFGRASTEELAGWIAAREATIIDNNRRPIYEEGHIPGAIHIPWDRVTADKLPADKNARLVFYCANPQCFACHKGAKAAVDLGYTNVWIYPDGIQGWRDAGQKIEK